MVGSASRKKTATLTIPYYALSTRLKTHVPIAEGENTMIKIRRPRQRASSQKNQLCHALVENSIGYFFSHSNQIWTSVFSRSPYSSVNHGGAGVAFALYDLARIVNQPKLLDFAAQCVEHSLLLGKDAAAFYNPALPITEAEVGRRSLYHTLTGVFAVRAQIAAARGDVQTCVSSVDGFISSSDGECPFLDVTLGYAGILLGCALLIESLHNTPTNRVDSLRDYGIKVMDKIWSNPLFKTNQYLQRLEYLGIAHGVAGVLYATLRFCHTVKLPFPKPTLPRLQRLASIGGRISEARIWPTKYKQNQISGGCWCNGSAGFVQLWCQAYEILADKAFLNLAVESANIFKPQGGNGGIPSLCCGMAGQGFAYLRLFGATGDCQWLAEAQKCVANATDPERFFLAGEHSLYKGRLGLLSLAGGLLNPVSAKMPLFG